MMMRTPDAARRVLRFRPQDGRHTIFCIDDIARSATIHFAAAASIVLHLADDYSKRTRLYFERPAAAMMILIVGGSPVDETLILD